jgi:hypothetical protein
LDKFKTDRLTLGHSQMLDDFFVASEDFANVFMSVSLADYRRLKTEKPENFIHLVSYAVRTMHMMATNIRVIEEGDAAKLRGAIHVLNRAFPLLLEDKDMFIECMWREKPFFNSQINAINMMEAISVLNFKEGFTIE